MGKNLPSGTSKQWARSIKRQSTQGSWYNKPTIEQSKDTGQRTRRKEANSESEVMQQLKEAIYFCVAEFR